LGISTKLAKSVMDEAEQDPGLMAARGRAYDSVGGKIAGTVTDIIDSIKPEHLETKIHEIKDKDGNLKRVVQTGPSLRDKAFAAGILTDKIQVMQNARQMAHTAVSGDERATLMLPGDVESAERRVVQLFKNLNFVQIHVQDTKMNERLAELREQAKVTHQDIEEAELVELASEYPFD
jgi:hypothetical protein